MAIIKIRNAAIDLDAAEIPNLPASKITSGTLDNARISLDAAEIPNLDTAKITTGTLADARIPANALNSNVSVPNAFRNIIINGDMSVAQRGTSFTSVTANTYTLDRWLTSGTGYTLTITQDTDVPTGQGFATSNKLQVTSANTSPSAGQSLQYQTRFEGQMLQYLKFGTSSAESLTMSFWVKSNLTGVYCTEFQNDDNDKTRGANFTISSANTWEKKTITISGDTASGFTNDNNRSMRLSFGLMSGSNTTGTNASIANWVTRSSNITSIFPNLGVNFCSSTSNYINIAGVQLEAGTTASDFEFLPVDVNLQRCQRYFQKSYDLGTAPGTATDVGVYWTGSTADASGNASFLPSYKTALRTSPTLTGYARDGTSGQGSYFRSGASGNGTLNSHMRGQMSSSVYIATGGSAYSTATIASHVTLDSEL